MLKQLLFLLLLLWCFVGTIVAQDNEDVGTQLTYFAPNSGLTFDYPSNWTLIDDELRGLTLVSNPTILDRRLAGYDNLFADETLLSIRFIATDTLDGWGIEGGTPEERLTSFSEKFKIGATLGIIKTTDDNISQLPISLDNTFEGMVMIWDISDDLSGFAILLTAIGNLENVTATVNDILLSTEFNSTIEDIIASNEETSND